MTAIVHTNHQPQNDAFLLIFEILTHAPSESGFFHLTKKPIYKRQLAGTHFCVLSLLDATAASSKPGPGGECLGARDRLNEVRSLTAHQGLSSEQLGFMVVVWLHLSEAKLGPLDLIGRFFPCFGGLTFNNRGQLGSG